MVCRKHKLRLGTVLQWLFAGESVLSDTLLFAEHLMHSATSSSTSSLGVPSAYLVGRS